MIRGARIYKQKLHSYLRHLLGWTMYPLDYCARGMANTSTLCHQPRIWRICNWKKFEIWKYGPIMKVIDLMLGYISEDRTRLATNYTKAFHSFHTTRLSHITWARTQPLYNHSLTMGWPQYWRSGTQRYQVRHIEIIPKVMGHSSCSGCQGMTIM